MLIQYVTDLDNLRCNSRDSACHCTLSICADTDELRFPHRSKHIQKLGTCLENDGGCLAVE